MFNKKEYMKKYNQQIHVKKMKEQWRKDNPKKIKELRKQYYDKHKNDSK